MTVNDLANVNENARKIINAYLKAKDLKRTPFAKMVGVHPLQMTGFLDSKAGLTGKTLEKIGEFIQNDKTYQA